ncbi:hypothetical protein [Haloferax sp. DFSO52]|uniref:hypothetical protein n=1 Tax=Haloferax sp. DFSO52 TaxID=3388505 RepID=UPI003A83B6F2
MVLGRRAFLTVLGASALGSTAGCLGRERVVPADETDAEWPSVPSIVNVPEDAHTVTTHVVGHRGLDDVLAGEPIGVVVANGANSSTEVTISIERRDLFSWTSLYDGRHGLAAPTRIDFILRNPATYRIRLSTPDHEAEKQIPESDFDCNDKAYSLVVTDEEIAQSSISTTAGCGF